MSEEPSFEDRIKIIEKKAKSIVDYAKALSKHEDQDVRSTAEYLDSDAESIRSELEALETSYQEAVERLGQYREAIENLGFRQDYKPLYKLGEIVYRKWKPENKFIIVRVVQNGFDEVDGPVLKYGIVPYPGEQKESTLTHKDSLLHGGWVKDSTLSLEEKLTHWHPSIQAAGLEEQSKERIEKYYNDQKKQWR